MLTNNEDNLNPDLRKDQKLDEMATLDNKTPEGDIPFDYDDYWLAFAKQRLDNTLPDLIAHYKSLITFLDGLSATSFIGGISLLTYFQSDNPCVYFLIFFPILVLQWAKYKIKIDLNDPLIKDSINLRSPVQINKAYNSFVTGIIKKIKKAKPILRAAVLIYLIFIPFGIFIQNTNSNKKVDADIKVSFDKYLIYIEVDKETDIKNLELFIEGKSISKKQDTIIKTTISSTTDKQLHLHFPLQQFDVTPSRVKLSYTANDKNAWIEFPAKEETTIQQKSTEEDKLPKSEDSIPKEEQLKDGDVTLNG